MQIPSLYPLPSHTHTHITILLWLLYFLWPVSTGLPRDQSQAVDLPYHKMSVVWSKTALALLEILNLLCRYSKPLQLTHSRQEQHNRDQSLAVSRMFSESLSFFVSFSFTENEQECAEAVAVV